MNYAHFLGCGFGALGCGLVTGGLKGTLFEEAFTSLTWVLVFLGMKTVENMQSMPTAIAKIQVPFSSTSVVCFTPMN